MFLLRDSEGAGEPKCTVINAYIRGDYGCTKSNNNYQLCRVAARTPCYPTTIERSNISNTVFSPEQHIKLQSDDTLFAKKLLNDRERRTE